MEYRYDTQLLIEGHDLDEDEIYRIFVSGQQKHCPFYRQGDDYTLARRQ